MNLHNYFVPIPPTLEEYLKTLAPAGTPWYELPQVARANFFRFWRSNVISDDMRNALQEHILSFYLKRRIGKREAEVWRYNFNSKFSQIMFYYEKLLASQEKEYFTNPILNVDKSTVTLNKLLQTDVQLGEENTVENTTKTENESVDKSAQRTVDESTNRNINEADTRNENGSWNENGNSTEINRYLDTPQGDASRVWERDAQGNLVLGNHYLTDIRGITNNYAKNGADNNTESGNKDTVDTIQKDTEEQRQEDEARNLSADGHFSGEKNSKEDLTRNATIDTDTDELGYSGVSPSKLLMEYRETFLRTFEDICTELEPMFYNLVEIEDLY